MDKYKLIDKVVAEIAKDKGISDGEVGTYETLLRVADIAVKNCSIPNVVGQSEQLECDVCYQPTNNNKDDEGKRYCDSCEEL